MPYDLKRISRGPDVAAAAAGEAAARVGEELRDARLVLGIPLEDMAERLRIRRPYLAALEEGRVRDLPGPAYALGFVRAYAKALGLDSDEMVRRYRDASGPAVTRKTDLVFPEPVPERGVPAGAVIMLGALLVVGGYAGWYAWSGSGDRTVDQVPPLPPRLEAAAERGAQSLPSQAPPLSSHSLGPRRTAAVASAVPTPSEPLTTGQGGSTTVPAAPAPAAGTMPSDQASAGPASGSPDSPDVMASEPAVAAGSAAEAGAPASAPDARPQALPTTAAEVTPPPAAPSSPASATPAEAAQAPPPDGPRIVLRASDESWIHVRDPRSGRVLINRVLRGGESWPVPSQDGLVLTTGRAEALDIVVDGAVSPLLTGVTGVRRDIGLDPDWLKSAQPMRSSRSAAASPAR